MNSEYYCNNIKGKLSKLVTEVKLDSAANLHSINIHAESFFREFLNTLYDWELINENEDEPNATGIDLRYKAKNIVVQVSSTTTHEKIQSSLDKSQSYSGAHFYFVAIADSLPVFRSKHDKDGNEIPPFNAAALKFNWKTDILTTANLFERVVKKGEIDRQRRLSELVDLYFDSWISRKRQQTGDGHSNTTNLYLFSAGTVNFHGREEEMRLLRQFLDVDSGFHWWAIVAPGGAGKTRLAYELKKALETENRWTVIFLRENGLHDYSALTNDELNRQLHGHTLLIVDYAQQCASSLGEWLKRLTADDFYRPAPLCMLLLERAVRDEEGYYPWEKELLQHVDEDRMKEKQFAEVLELSKLEERYQAAVIRDFSVTLREQEPHLPELTHETAAELLQRLNRMDAAGRPLFAMMLTDAKLHGVLMEDTNLEKLVESPVKREERLLKNRLLDIGSPNRLLEKAVFDIWRIATVLGAAGDPEWDKIKLICPKSAEQIDKVAEKVGLETEELLQRCGLLDGEAHHVQALRPDLFGEYWVLQWMEKNTAKKEKMSIFFTAILSDQLSAAGFFRRCLSDYPAYIGTADGLQEWFLPLNMKLEDKANLSLIQIMLDLFMCATKKAHRDWLLARMEFYAQIQEENETVAMTYNNLGEAYESTGNYSKALECYEQARAIEEKVLEPNHVCTATTYNNLGMVYDATGDYLKAVEFYKKALNIVNNSLGPNHPYAAVTCCNLGEAYRVMGEYSLALEYNERACNIRERVFGINHPDTAHSFNNMALVFQSMKDYPKALKLFEQALDIIIQSLGCEHVITSTIYNNIGAVYKDMGDYPKALDYYEKDRAITEKILGPDHPTTARNWNNIGLLYLIWDKPKEAIPWLHQALKVLEKTLGSEHPNTIITRNSLESAKKMTEQ